MIIGGSSSSDGGGSQLLGQPMTLCRSRRDDFSSSTLRRHKMPTAATSGAMIAAAIAMTSLTVTRPHFFGNARGFGRFGAVVALGLSSTHARNSNSRGLFMGAL